LQPSAQEAIYKEFAKQGQELKGEPSMKEGGAGGLELSQERPGPQGLPQPTVSGAGGNPGICQLFFKMTPSNERPLYS
jgi:hypothetical protein